MLEGKFDLTTNEGVDCIHRFFLEIMEELKFVSLVLIKYILLNASKHDQHSEEVKVAIDNIAQSIAKSISIDLEDLPNDYFGILLEDAKSL